ncbi:MULTISPECIES: STAS domain-containing protein [unclassified Brevundimonas]|uniref:STAS domain-containing protein n=1 Tax=unclassified Brevundimonas TaxID=2622653 RepID=UPI000CFB8250|nr:MULTISPECIES: STAS domain-containing protein [unclassified Brevundimonas]PRA27756.1 chemotaxis protein CheX [Brevundimonas sp. MYb27]PQZ81083.1 chemotaxis protein CheX [Brevundimonas sp. MYb31]PRB15350.1 chemotaxis protein CheX [Brevundimonas sp. MYb52]PRB35727.1 chemotaxis protein CheX [Brevundimonas sp. MYb46]PRB42774.1 chemotaxis protein CheX [Brevundimonas sp. MYb33]
MSTLIALPAVLDLRAAEPLKMQLLAVRGQAATLDASAVERLGGLCLQVLLSALQTWRSDGKSLSFVNVSEPMIAQWSALGASASDLAAQGQVA